MHVSSTAKRRTFSTLLLASVSILAVTAIPIMSYAQTADNGATEATETTDTGDGITLDPIRVEVQATSQAGDPTPPVYAGGQVATGGRVGVLGNQDNMDTPLSITSYTSELIENQQAKTIGDVLDNDPGVQVSQGYGNFGETFTIRGYTLGADDLSIDGLYGTAPRQLPDMSMFDRVEVLKGASAFLNGISPTGSGIGGSINLVPKRATDIPITRLTTSYDTDSQFGTHMDVGRRFGNEEQFGIRTNILWRGGGTSIEDETKESRAASIGLDYRGERTRITFDGGVNQQYVEEGRSMLRIDNALSAMPEAPSADINNAGSWTYADMLDTFGQVRTEYDVTSNLMAYVAVGARYMKESGNYATPELTGTDGTASLGSSLIKREDTSFTAKTGLRANFETGPVNHVVNTGVSGIWQKNRNAYNFVSGGSINIYEDNNSSRPTTQSIYAGSFDDLPLADSRELTSIFVSETAKFFDDDLQLTLGVRRQRVKVDDASPTNFFSQTNGYTVSTYDESANTPFVGINARISDYLSTYANYVEALQPGEEVTDNSASNFGQTLAPYKSEQFEVGAKMDFGTFGGSIALFQIDKPSAYNDNGTYKTSGNQRNRGLEVQAFGEPVKGTRILGGVTFYDAEITETDVAENIGKTPKGIPEYIAKVGIEYDLPFFTGATVNARVIHTGSQYVRNDNSLEIPSWTRLDVGGRYETKLYDYPVTWRANIENLTNNDYWSSASTSASSFNYVTQGAPLTASISLTADF